MTRIAFPTDDGETIGAHVGQARYFGVVTLTEDGRVLTERRDKPVHQHAPGDHEHPSADDPLRAAKMLAIIADCQVLIARGLGRPAYRRAQDIGLAVFLIAEKDIRAALVAYQNHSLVSDERRIHH
jgi:predicted Fe-Mo cluster-binding NifX family protein